MIKYLNYMVGFSEIPDEISLCINITGCIHRCHGCHSPLLWKDIGTPLTKHELYRIIDKNDGISCVCFMGEGGSTRDIDVRAKWVKQRYPKLKTAIYSGRTYKALDWYLSHWDYIKLGAYIESKGGLDKLTTNQRLYKADKISHYLQDITYKFWLKYKKKDNESISKTT